jgi:phosphoribosyl 1,2-cyclic phosphodiesterase
MKLISLNSNSKGNGYVLSSPKGSLLLEAGFCSRNVNPFQLAVLPVLGCVVSHHHTDHAKFARQFARRVETRGTQSLAELVPDVMPMAEGKTYHFGDFSVSPFKVPHYNADETICENFGYLIHHPEMGSLLFATDTFMLPYKFPKVNHFLIECNYQDELLNDQVEHGDTTLSQKKRIQLSHMSLNGCIEALKQCGVEKTRTIVLCHLSARHADPDAMVKAIQSKFGIPVYVAKKNNDIPLI